MSDASSNAKQAQIDALRRERDQLAEQIRLGRETIARSEALLERLNAMLAKLEQPER